MAIGDRAGLFTKPDIQVLCRDLRFVELHLIEPYPELPDARSAAPILRQELQCPRV